MFLTQAGKRVKNITNFSCVCGGGQGPIIQKKDRILWRELIPGVVSGLKKEAFNYEGKGKESVNGLVCQIVDLVPRDKNASFYRIRLAISEDLVLQQYQMWDRANTIYETTFSNFKVNVPLKDSFFQFDGKSHPGANVVDLRD